jgi:hypothetical protein
MTKGVVVVLMLLPRLASAEVEPDLVVLESFASPTVHLAAMTVTAVALLSSGLIKIRLSNTEVENDPGTIAAAAAFLTIPPLLSAAVTYGIADSSRISRPSFLWTLLAGVLANAGWFAAVYLADLPPGWALAAPIWAGAAEVLTVNLRGSARAEGPTAGLSVLLRPAPTPADPSAILIGAQLGAVNF